MSNYQMVPGYHRFKPKGRLLIVTAAKLPEESRYAGRRSCIPKLCKNTYSDIPAGLLLAKSVSFYWFNRVFSVELQTTTFFWDGSKFASPLNGKEALFIWFGRFQTILKTRLE